MEETAHLTRPVPVELSFGFELDVYSSRDNQLVVIHNENFQGTTNGPNRRVRELTVAELKQEAGCDGMLTDFPLECRLHWRNQE